MWPSTCRLRAAIIALETFRYSVVRPRLSTTVSVSREKHKVNACTLVTAGSSLSLDRLSRRSIGLSTPRSRCRDPRGGPTLVGRSVGIHKASGPLGRKHKGERLCNNMATPLRVPHTGVTVIYVSPGERVSRTHISRDPCFPAHISLGIRVPHQELSVICVSRRDFFSISPHTHIPRDSCFSAHISLGIRVSH